MNAEQPDEVHWVGGLLGLVEDAVGPHLAGSSPIWSKVALRAQ
ncbi:hypothetical protein [Streptomyces europaeiscabiei]|nr:hypothetical protein [Streptomyces europaeiscabiei]MDX3615389.1 hypothetical protein [Streptomyces europaeiscabiei]